MNARTLTITAALALTVGAGWMWSRSAMASADAPFPVPELVGGLAPEMSDAELTRQQIAFHEGRMQGDPRAALDRAALASLYLQRSREGGGFEDFRRAEEMARQSLAIRVQQNSRAARMLAASLLAQHRFAEAYEVARELVRIWPEDPAHRALLAELQMEMGDYDEAQVTLASLQGQRDNLSVAPRFARWAEANGQREEERRLLYRAAELAMIRTDLPREQVAWFHLRVAEHELRYGRLEEAEKAIRAGLQEEPGDFRLVSSLVRLEAQRGRWKEAIAYGAMVGDAADLRTLAAIGDAHAALGDQAGAERFYRMVEESAAANPEPYNRQWTQFRLDHDRNLPETLALLQEEIQGRRDVLGYDMLAWALYKTGDFPAARAAMQQALRLGTKDPVFLLHAAAIERALGAKDRANQLYREARDLNPRLETTHPRLVQAARG